LERVVDPETGDVRFIDPETGRGYPLVWEDVDVRKADTS
jgi:hypothetical protein